MPQLAQEFAEARHNVEPEPSDVENAADAHAQVRRALEASGDLSGMDIDTILIGSYARNVSIRRMKDVDVFSKLHKPDRAKTGRDLLQLFNDVLVNEFGEDRVEKQDRSIKVEFPDYDLSVDAVPARPYGSHWEIPDRENGWEETDPLELGTLSSKMNTRYHEQYVPTVKLVRQARRANLGDEQPGGLYLEIATYQAFSEGLTAKTAGEYFCEALSGAAEQLRRARSSGLPDPALPGHIISTRATDEDLAHAEQVFRDLAQRSKDALTSDDPCAAAYEFRQVLGQTTDEEWVFPMPSYCNEDGTRRSSSAGIRSGSRTVAEGGRFA